MRNRLLKILSTFIFLVSAFMVEAQTKYKSISLEKDSLGSFASRLSISTNFVDWALMTPNIGFDIDLGNQNMIGAQSLNFNFKYRPDGDYSTKVGDGVILNSPNIFNYFSGRIEYRWHFRFNEHPAQRRGLTRPALWIQEKLAGKQYSSERMARAMESSSFQRPEMIRGRHYVGVFAEYMNFTLNSKLDIIDRDKVKYGNAFMFGLSGGYDFPAFYHNKHYWQFHVGANVGVMYAKYDRYEVDENKMAHFDGAQTKVLPMVTELRFGLTYRKESISRKYWKPSNRIQLSNIAENREMQALIDTITTNYSTALNIYISVPKVEEKTLAIKTPINKKEVINEIRKQTNLPLSSANFINDTIFPIRRLDDYTITYRVKKAINKYSDELEDYTDVVFKFRVELEGRQEAEKQKESFVNAIRKYREEKGIPVLYARAKPNSGNRNEVDGYVPYHEVMTLFSRIWGKTISLQQFKGVSERVGVGVLRPVDEKGINRRSRYVIKMVFHPQVTFDYESEPVNSQFEIKFRGEASGLSMYNKINGLRLSFTRKWSGGDTFSPEITPDDIVKELKNRDIVISANMVNISDGQNRFNQRYTAAVYLQAGYVANVSYTVQDKEGLERANNDMKEKIRPWIAQKKWPEIIMRGEPKDPAELEITQDMIMTAFRKASGYTFYQYNFIDFCVDGNYQLMPDGRYRAYAKVRLHQDSSDIMKIPYYIRFAQ